MAYSNSMFLGAVYQRRGYSRIYQMVLRGYIYLSLAYPLGGGVVIPNMGEIESIGRENTQGPGFGHGLGTALDIQLGVDVVGMNFYGARSDVQPLADLFIG